MAAKKKRTKSKKKKSSKSTPTVSKKSKSSKKKSGKKPKTMADLLEKYGTDIRTLERGDKVEGKIIRKTSKAVFLDINRKTEGLVAEKAFNEAKDYIKSLEVGDEVEASVIIPETPDGYTILSFREAKQDAAWKKINEADRKGNPLVVRGKAVTSAGMIVDVEGLTGFIPSSQLGKAVEDEPKQLIDEYFKVKVLEVSRDDNKIVLSEKEVSDAEDIALTKKAMKTLKEGEVYIGEITTVTDFGCFVKIPIKLKGEKKKAFVEGLVHISEASWGKIENIRKEFSEGDKVEVKVIGVEDVKKGQIGKLALSIKRAKDDPWMKAKKKYKVDSKHTGEVVRLSDFGAFIELEPGIEGLVHVTKIPPGTKLEKGKDVKVYVEEIDSDKKKLSLGLVLTKKPVGYK